jgi:hypothetical protein
MKKMFIALILTLVPLIAFASPFLVSDPASHGVGIQYEIWEGAKALTDSQVLSTGALVFAWNNQPDGSIRYDMAGVGNGTRYWYIRYCAGWGYYGDTNTEVTGVVTCSSFVPFVFTKRASPSVGPVKVRPVP